jgi:vacuolar-type H+-ATPase subunit I/STV1
MRQDLQKLKVKADEEAPLVDEDGNELPLKAELEALGEENLEDVEAALDEAEAKLNEIEADPNVLRLYKEKQQQMEDVQQQLDDLTSSKDNKMIELNQKLDPWENALQNSVAKVDTLFSKYMAELGCTGEWNFVCGRAWK